MHSPGIIIPINSDSASTSLVFLIFRHIPEFSYAMLTINGSVKQCDILLDAIKHLPHQR
jgi:hypothetical protein